MITDGLTPPIALVEVDPPYGINLKMIKKGDESRALNRYEEIPATEYVAWTDKLLDLLYETTPENCRIIYWFGIEWYSMLMEAFESHGFQYDHIPCIWNKGVGQTNAPDLYLARSYECFFSVWKGDQPMQGRGRANVFNYAPVPQSLKYHPTQRPLELMLDILKTFGWPSTILMCPFLGSGVTIRAAYKLNMIPFGWELNEENKPKLLAAVEKDIEAYKVNQSTDEVKDPTIPF